MSPEEQVVILERKIARQALEIARSKRRVARLRDDVKWAENEREITHRWAEESWEMVRHLRTLLERAMAHNDESTS